MNYVDRNFEWLTSEIKGKTKIEVFEHIKKKYQLLPLAVKQSMEQFLSDFPYWGVLDDQKKVYEEIHNKAESLHDHIDDYRWLYQHLKDYRSKKLLFAILYNWYDYDFTTLKELMDQTYCHYFDLDIVTCDQEILVDVGAYIGDSTLDFIHSYGLDAYQKIYCYEMTDETFLNLQTNVKDYPNIVCCKKAVTDRQEVVSMDTNRVNASANVLVDNGNTFVETVTLDDDISEPITMVKMDIEGAETKALLGCRRHIVEDHPKLLLSVYHNHEDLWKIPKMIEEICPGYEFYLRFYGSNIFPTEIVLFAIYPEKDEIKKSI